MSGITEQINLGLVTNRRDSRCDPEKEKVLEGAFSGHCENFAKVHWQLYQKHLQPAAGGWAGAGAGAGLQHGAAAGVSPHPQHGLSVYSREHLPEFPEREADMSAQPVCRGKVALAGGGRAPAVSAELGTGELWLVRTWSRDRDAHLSLVSWRRVTTGWLWRASRGRSGATPSPPSLSWTGWGPGSGSVPADIWSTEGGDAFRDSYSYFGLDKDINFHNADFKSWMYRYWILYIYIKYCTPSHIIYIQLAPKAVMRCNDVRMYLFDWIQETFISRYLENIFQKHVDRCNI